MNTDLFFKALSRPAMLFGVPMMPLLSVMMFILFSAIYINLFFFFLAIPIFFIMRFMAKKDDMIFRLLFLKLKFFTNPAQKKFYKTKAYVTSSYTHNKTYNNLTKLSISALHSLANISSHIPFQTLINNHIITTKECEYVATFVIDGVDFEVENSVDLEVNKNKLNMLIKSYSSENISFYFHNCRIELNDYLNSLFKNNFLKDFNDRYYSNFNQLKENKLVLSVIYSPLNKLASSKFKKLSVETKIQEIRQHVKNFEELLLGIEGNLKDFGVARLGKYIENNIVYSSQLEFYNFLLSGIFSKVRVNDTVLCDYLQGNMSAILFGHNIAQIDLNNGKKRFLKAIEIKEYPNYSYIGMLDHLMYLNINYVITQSFTPMKKVDAKEAIGLQKKRLISAEDDAISQIIDIDQALDDLTSGEISFGNYHFSLIVYADSIKEVEENTNIIISKLADEGFLTTIANIALPATYFAQIPANYQIRPRLHKISSKNYASLIALHNFGKGKKDKNCWGQAVSILRTPNGSPYYFNFHETRFNHDDFGELLLANTMILGKSGGGKTALMNFLLNQLAKYSDPSTFPVSIPEDKKKATFFYLDKDKGAIGNIIAQNGTYITIDGGNPTGFNPFMCDNTPENIRNLQILMKLLVTRNDEKISVKEEEDLNFAVISIMNNFNKEERKYGITLMLEHLTEGTNEINSIRSRLAQWSKNKQFGWVFDNENDNFSFKDDCNLFGIDGTDLLSDNDINGPVSFYILWRIFEKCDGRRFALFVDEAWDWIRNPVVAKEIHNKEKTIRKLNGFLVLGTQSVEDFAKSPIASAIIEQSATILLLSNPQAKEDDYCKVLNLSKEEYEFAKNTIPSMYQVLIKKAEERAIVSLDLSSIGKTYLKIISTGKAYVEKLEKINKLEVDYKTKFQKILELYNESIGDCNEKNIV
ncbi:VirB3 family type IV secretion system protein [Campylobacter sp. RM12642]|uniref:VirB4 family type IV secretion/conjugal transfer ATPase n=1 Tax=unclassified Campylobacter TaxID=2593542 RepID=UPI00301536D6|nr:VirB3 family type IV secretion system protein [Campylobacter sp. RM12654]MBZ7980458.1 VirB3 family type IV secretion system protein [Campylobacter sp. RM12642]